MSKPPPVRRTEITDPIMRALVDKVRSNANVAMLQALGGEFIYDEAAHDRARGYAVQMETLNRDTGERMRFRFTVVPKP